MPAEVLIPAPVITTMLRAAPEVMCCAMPGMVRAARVLVGVPSVVVSVSVLRVGVVDGRRVCTIDEFVRLFGAHDGEEGQTQSLECVGVESGF